MLDFEPDSVIGGSFLQDAKKGQTIGAALLLPSVDATRVLDTLLSYARQSAELGWLGRDRDDDCDDDERAEDGIVRNIERRLQKAKTELEKEDSVKTRRELEKLVRKVERIWKRSEKRERGDQKDLMTSEAYALLKYNAEYLIDRLPEGKGKREDLRRKREKD